MSLPPPPLSFPENLSLPLYPPSLSSYSKASSNLYYFILGTYSNNGYYSQCKTYANRSLKLLNVLDFRRLRILLVYPGPVINSLRHTALNLLRSVGEKFSDSVWDRCQLNTLISLGNY